MPDEYGEFEMVNGAVANRLQRRLDRVLEEIDHIARECTHSEDAEATCRSVIDRMARLKNEL